MSQGTVDELRALWERVCIARAERDAHYETLLRLGEELSLCEPAEAWACPKPADEEERREDPRIFWNQYHAYGREYKGALYGPGHERAPAAGERGQWCIGAGVAVQGKKPHAKPWDRDDGEPKNVELGERIHTAAALYGRLCHRPSTCARSAVSYAFSISTAAPPAFVHAHHAMADTLGKVLEKLILPKDGKP